MTSPAADPAKTHLVVTVHGIRTYGNWQRVLGDQIEARDPHAKVVHFQFGYFLPWRSSCRSCATSSSARFSAVCEGNREALEIVMGLSVSVKRALMREAAGFDRLPH